MSQDFGTQMGRQTGRILIVMGVIWIVIAVILQVTLADVPYAGDTIRSLVLMFGAIGVVMIVASVFMFRKSAGRALIETEGTPATARILGLTQTGMYLNEQPQIGMDLEVSGPGLATYRVEHREFVPLLLLSRLQPGAVLAVRVDPANPKRIVVRWNEAPASVDMSGLMSSLASPAAAAGAGSSGMPTATGASYMAGTSSTAQPQLEESLGNIEAILAQAGMGGIGGAAKPYVTPDQADLNIDQLRAWLRENGIPGKARIIRLEDSGRIIGNDRLFTMQTTVEVPGQPPYTSPASAATVPLEKVGRIAVGVTLPVRVAPGNADLLMFEWDMV